MGLAEHERRVALDLEMLDLPPKGWTATVPGPDGQPMLDVLIVGAGVSGLAAAAMLLFKGVRNVLVLDRAPEGREGIWTTIARMQTLRTPKTLPGLGLGVPSLTFRAWYTARHGEQGWAALHKFPNQNWQDYLGWVRRVLALPVRNGVEVRAILPHQGHLMVETSEGRLFARQVVMATGRARADTIDVPDGIAPDLWPDRAAHTAEEIDFARLAGRRVAVIGAAASAWDNAAVALEHGAAHVDMYMRRAILPQVNRNVVAFTPALFEGWPSWPLEERWRMLLLLMRDHRPPPPWESVLRVTGHANFTLHGSSPVLRAERAGEGVRLTLGTDPARMAEADFLILGTGFRMDFDRTPELAAFRGRVALWRDAYAPPPDRAWPSFGRFPLLGDGFELTERSPGSCPGAGRLRLFNFASIASLGYVGTELPAVSTGAERLASRLAAALSLEDIEHLRAMLENHRVPALDRTPFHAPEAFA